MPASHCTLVYPRSLRLNFVGFFSFFFNYLIDSHLPQPEVLGYVIYNNTSIIEKTTFFFNLNKYIHIQERLYGAQLLLSNRPFWTLVNYHHMKKHKVKGFSRTKSTHCAMALHFIFLQCQVSGQANGFPLYIRANSSVLHLDLSEIHQKCDLITSPPVLPLPKRV